MLGALKDRDASLASGHMAPPFPGAPGTGTCVPHAAPPGRGAKQHLLSGSHRPSHLAALLRRIRAPCRCRAAFAGSCSQGRRCSLL